MPYTKGEQATLAISLLLLLGGAGYCASENLFRANQRSKAKRTMADMRTIGTAWEAYATDHNRYNAAGAAMQVPAPQYPAGSEAATLPYTFGDSVLVPLLEPKYIKKFPRVDGWGHEWQFGIDQPWNGGKDDGAQNYAIRSPGRNGTFDDPIVAGETKTFDDDIVFSNGVFISYAGR